MTPRGDGQQLFAAVKAGDRKSVAILVRAGGGGGWRKREEPYDAAYLLLIKEETKNITYQILDTRMEAERAVVGWCAPYPTRGVIQGGPQLLFRNLDGLVGGDDELRTPGREKMLTIPLKRL
jgi:hypothetical protein